jgi:L-arabinose isomerase
MHTFSPSKMWIGGLSALRKPFLHLHTQYDRDPRWSEIDMDFMNLNQSAMAIEADLFTLACDSIERW